MPPVTRKKVKLVEAKKAVDAEKYTKRALCIFWKALLLDVSRGVLEAYKKNGNWFLYDHVEVLLKQLVKKEPWVTRNAESDLTGQSTRWKSRVGRPSGSTEDRKFHEKRNNIEVKNECTRQFANLKKKTKERNRKRVSPSALQEMIEKV